jgi:hypothetical protein
VRFRTKNTYTNNVNSCALRQVTSWHDNYFSTGFLAELVCKACSFNLEYIWNILIEQEANFDSNWDSVYYRTNLEFVGGSLRCHGRGEEKFSLQEFF